MVALIQKIERKIEQLVPSINSLEKTTAFRRRIKLCLLELTPGGELKLFTRK